MYTFRSSAAPQETEEGGGGGGGGGGFIFGQELASRVAVRLVYLLSFIFVH